MYTLKDLLRRDDWMTNVELKDAYMYMYFMVPIHSKDRPLLAALLCPNMPFPVDVPPFQPVECSLGLYQTLKLMTTLVR